MFGIVLLSAALTPVAWATWTQPQLDHEVIRSVQMAVAVVDKLDDWFAHYGVERVRIGLELPIYNHNAVTHAKQWRLIQTVEDTLCGLAQYSGVEVDLYEVGPSASKKALTGKGDATKIEMVAASPFRDLAASQDVREALADAFGHALAAGHGVIGWRLNNLRRQFLAPAYEGKA